MFLYHFGIFSYTSLFLKTFRALLIFQKIKFFESGVTLFFPNSPKTHLELSKQSSRSSCPKYSFTIVQGQNRKSVSKTPTCDTCKIYIIYRVNFEGSPPSGHQGTCCDTDKSKRASCSLLQNILIFSAHGKILQDHIQTEVGGQRVINSPFHSDVFSNSLKAS